MADRLAATLALDEPASRVKLVSPARAQALAGLGVRTVRDLLTHFPRRYIDLSKRETVAGARIGGSCTIQGTVHEVKLKRPRPNLTLVEIAVVDATGVLMVTCFRQPWLKDQLKPGMGIAVAGKVEFDYGFKRMVNPYIEQLGDGQVAEGMIIPVHPACEKISAAWMRRLVGNALDAVQGCYDPLPLDLRVRYRLMTRAAALSCIHFPHTMEEAAEARRRLVYEELLLLELALMSQAAQRAAGAQPAALMAPTEVLARQHAASLGKWFDEVGVTWGLLTGSTPDDERARLLKGAADGGVCVLIGTHALLEPDVRFKRLTLAVIDEQQRFGVEQRAALLSKGEAPDALYLTATPIPRTLALAVFGDMTLSYIKHRPNDSARRTTHVVSKADQGRAYDAACEALSRGEQVYVVCPLIGQDAEARDKRAGGRGREADEEAYEFASISIESDADFAGDNVTAATKEASYLQQTVFADWHVELLHGRMKPADKDAVMGRFRDNETQVLVATTVIEVGVDVPNATVMIVMDADRFGLSQLHQLRGRVGRGEKPAQVFLVSTSKSEQSLARLAAMERTDDGFELAKYDLSLRREGDILGNRQSGASALKLVNIVRDERVVQAAHADAAAIMAADPGLAEPDHQALALELRRTFPEQAPAR